MSMFLHFVGKQAAHRANRAGFLDFRRGFELLRDRSVPAIPKLLALFVGVGFTLLLEAVEAPIEGIVAVLLPFVGAAIDLMIDGAELLILPMLIASLVIQRLVPRRMATIRQGPPPTRSLPR